jgi:hypothetical protein
MGARKRTQMRAFGLRLSPDEVWQVPAFVEGGRSLARGPLRSGRPSKAGRTCTLLDPYLPISDLALSGVIAVVGTVTVVDTLSAQSSRIAFAISIASGPPVG